MEAARTELPPALRLHSLLPAPGAHREIEVLVGGRLARAAPQVNLILARRRPEEKDITELGRRWQVLPVSFPWEQREQPLDRAVRSSTAPAVRQRALLPEWLTVRQASLPGPLTQSVLVLDRGFPGPWLVRELQARGFRFVLRMTRRWQVTHAEYKGPRTAASTGPGLVGSTPRLLRKGSALNNVSRSVKPSLPDEARSATTGGEGPNQRAHLRKPPALLAGRQA